MSRLARAASIDSRKWMKDTNPPAGSEHPEGQSETNERPGRTTWSAFIEHLRHGHGVKDVPEDETEAWQLHQKLHGR